MEMDFYELEKLATLYRIECLTSIYQAGSGHTGSSMSVMDILTALYHGTVQGEPILKYDAQKPDWDEQDYFVLSQGHAAPALYTVLANCGFFHTDELSKIRQLGSFLQGYPSLDVPGVGMTTGSLGQGFSSALGMALALKMDEKPNRVYALLNDAELQEGQVWETAMCAAHHKVNNLIAIIDHNGVQVDGTVHSVMEVEPIHSKFTSFGWRVFHAPDGHDYADLLESFEHVLHGNVRKERPAVIIANTVKGKGVPFAENNVTYHRTALSKEEMEHVIPQLKEQLERLESKIVGAL
jgi:transketolase